MLPTRPEGIPEELWNLELPSILGPAHAGFCEQSEPSTLPLSPLSSQPTLLDSGSDDEMSVDAHSSVDPTPYTAGTLDGPFETKDFQDVALVSSEAVTSFQVPTLGSTLTSPDTHLQDWNVAESQMHLVLAPLSHLVLSGQSSPLNEADHLAYGILHAGVARFADIAKLLDLLPSATHAKRRKHKCEQLQGQRSFSAGAFAIGGLFGVQNSMSSHPWTTMLLTSILRGADPNHRFSSLTLQRNVLVHLHQDNNNEPGFSNLIVPCSRWRGGCLWIQATGGAHALDHSSGPGTMTRITWPGITFSPHVKHATMPWTGGDRVILVSFQTRWVHSLSGSDTQLLRQMGFNVDSTAASSSSAHH